MGFGCEQTFDVEAEVLQVLLEKVVRFGEGDAAGRGSGRGGKD